MYTVVCCPLAVREQQQLHDHSTESGTGKILKDDFSQHICWLLCGLEDIALPSLCHGHLIMKWG